MTDLAQKKCIPCEVGGPSFNRAEAEALMAQVPGWELDADAKSISKTFKFKDFAQALEFVNAVGKIAESEGHHPDIEFGWGKAKISLTTHAINGLSENESAVADAIRTLKYDGTREAASLLASALADYLREEMAGIKAFSPRPIILVPVPLHPSRVRERGFNQMERVLENLPDEFRNGNLARLSPKALLRMRATKQQTRLSRTERLKNVAKAFAADRTAVGGTHCVIIDDVTTTGATLSECARALESAGAVVTAIALARA